MGDLIERQAVIDALNEVINKDRYIRVVDAVASILDVPTPKPKKGKWTDEQQDRWIYAKCSECLTIHDVKTNYCPNCGADMRGEEE